MVNEANFLKLRKLIAACALIAEQEVSPDSDIFADLDIDSLCLIEAFVEIERAFGVKLHPATLARETFNTPRKLMALIDQSCP